MKLDFNDLLIVPAVTSDIESRSEVNPYYTMLNKQHLPIIAAPMDTVIDEHNVKLFESNRINYCIPRGSSANPVSAELAGVMSFQSYGLDEFIAEFISTKITYKTDTRYILIDIANGHMNKLATAIKEFKSLYKSYYTLMVGNVANPETYRLLSLMGADYVRIGIGNGNGCLTTQQLGIGYPMASLIQECYHIKQTMSTERSGNIAKIVADGGMKNYSDIIKALALGADYVMVGSILNKALESAGPTYFMGIEIDQHADYAKWLFKKGFKLNKKFRGMSTKEVQRLWNKDNLKTSEGVIRYRPVEYTINGWTKNFTDYLKSAMSYTDKKTLLEFTGTVNFIQITDNAYLRYNK
jgi:IMP dehydrogenase/GMP reductase